MLHARSDLGADGRHVRREQPRPLGLRGQVPDLVSGPPRDERRPEEPRRTSSHKWGHFRAFVRFGAGGGAQLVQPQRRGPGDADDPPAAKACGVGTNPSRAQAISHSEGTVAVGASALGLATSSGARRLPPRERRAPHPPALRRKRTSPRVHWLIPRVMHTAQELAPAGMTNTAIIEEGL